MDCFAVIRLGPGVSAKDVVLHITGVLGAAGTGSPACNWDDPGSVSRTAHIEGRLTISNMAIEHGARAGLVAPSSTTFPISKGVHGAEGHRLGAGRCLWRALATDPGATYKRW